ncbi:MAG TPA: tail fiber protein [Thermoanaerobaculia bacterium]|jgi:microcystin-dependent protein|nr:tail fiber protein [Thermoanaerobaculia bacterium]
MADPFVAEVRIFPFNFPPKGWAFCDGQLLPLSQNTALFSLLGTYYGGDGKSTFALPDCQGSGVIHPGQGQGLSLYDLGQTGGTENVNLLVSEMPLHTHALENGIEPGNIFGPDPAEPVILTRATGGSPYSNTVAPVVMFAPQALAPAGGSLPHNNMMPYLTLNFCIALQGVFPPRP